MAEAEFTDVRHCTGCGANVAFEGPTLSITCGYCDSPLVDERRAAAAIDAVVPFQIPKRGAVERVRAHLEGHRWAPSELRRLRVHGRGFRGVLVPFWIYEGVIRSEYRARIGIDWTRHETVHEHGEVHTRDVRETEWFSLTGTAARRIEDHRVSASVGLPAREADLLDSFDLGRATGFDPRLLSGFEAELASVTTADGDRLAIATLREAEGPRLQRELLPGDRNRLDRITSEIELHRRKLVLLPIWIATYRHGGAVLRLLVNGQTGEVAGRVPISTRRVVLTIAVALALVITVGLLVWWLGGRP